MKNMETDFWLLSINLVLVEGEGQMIKWCSVPIPVLFIPLLSKNFGFTFFVFFFSYSYLLCFRGSIAVQS